MMSYYDWDLQNAEKELRQAATLDPKYPRARQVLAENLTIRGRFQEAVIEAQRALELDPLALSLNAFMAIYGRCWCRERTTFWDLLGKIVIYGAGEESSPSEEEKTPRNERWWR
jgi:tetratricopeptide (TPR) repeat protein